MKCNHIQRVLGFCLIIAIFGSSLRALHASELIVADRGNDQIETFDPNTGAFDRVLVSSGLDEPTGLSFGPNGYLYVADRGSGSVLMFDPVTGQAKGTFVSGLSEPAGLLYDSTNNRMYVSEFNEGIGQNIFVYDASGNLVANSGNPINAGATGHYGLAFGPGGKLYASAFQTDQFASGLVAGFDPTNNYAALGTFASGGGLAGAAGVFFDNGTNNDGNLYVAGLLSQNVVKYGISGGSVTSAAAFGSSIAYPSGIIAAPDGNLLVTSLGNDNPRDPIFGGLLFPGMIVKLDASTGAQINSPLDSDEPFITYNESFEPTAMLLSPVPEPATWILAVLGGCGLAAGRRRIWHKCRRQSDIRAG